MRTCVVTGARGFIGQNLKAHLQCRNDLRILTPCRENSAELLAALSQADVIFHLAGVNRPRDENEWETGNVGFTEEICRQLRSLGRQPLIVFSSSVQAEADNRYGASKRGAEEALIRFGRETGADIVIYRLKNLFGKWCRPNCHSVVATFCYNIARDLPIRINDPDHILELVYIDDVVAALLGELDEPSHGKKPLIVPDTMPSHSLTLGDLADKIKGFHAMQTSLSVPDFSVRFNQQLYATYLSYVEPARWQYALDLKSDNRGNLAEFVKSPSFGQVFISRTKPGITRGNHYHHTKTEKFFVVAGEGQVRLRHIQHGDIIEFDVRGEDYRVIDIPPGYTHSITNVGTNELITLFWASEVFDRERPDTAFVPVSVGDEP